MSFDPELVRRLQYELRVKSDGVLFFSFTFVDNINVPVEYSDTLHIQGPQGLQGPQGPIIIFHNLYHTYASSQRQQEISVHLPFGSPGWSRCIRNALECYKEPRR